MKIKKIHYILTALLPIQILTVSWLSTQPQWIEEHYSNNIYQTISSFFRFLLGWIPFSVGDILLIYFLYVSVRFFFRFFKTFKKIWKRSLFQIASFISVLYFCFYLFWGFNYFRKPLSENLGYKTKEYSTEKLVDLTSLLVFKINTIHKEISIDSTSVPEFPHSKKEIYPLANQAFKLLGDTYPQFVYKYYSVKSSLLSGLQSYNGTSGYLNPLTGEAHVNNKIPITGYPSTTCHEIAHQIGFAAENEANFIGFLASIYSDNKYFQYSGYRMAIRYTVMEVYRRDKELYKKLLTSLNSGILKDFNQSNDFWDQYKNPLEPFIKKGYNAYLKANNQAKGVQSYNYVVDLLISYYQL